MAHKTFISYKYSESQELRDKIVKSLGEDAKYYKGETSDSPDLTDMKTETIKNHLKDMLFDTTVTVVIISPNMKKSKWIDWEIEYSLKNIERDGRKSSINGIVGVIQKVNGSYDWFETNGTNCHGNAILTYHMKKVYDIISKNHFNSSPEIWHCNNCKTYDYFDGSYIAFVEEECFLENPNKYIENAYKKSQNDGRGYNLLRKK